eukprot:Hpha_TRINITY_DN14093_c0_g1::TRINITY_DN14093_c0_g1_i1::g.44145::m.44145/K00948/PRPS, prsA; ribose-phosphate pyrophosphokinase
MAMQPLKSEEECTAGDVERFQGTHFYSNDETLIGRSPLERRRSGMHYGATPPRSTSPEPSGPGGEPGYHLSIVTGRCHRKLSKDVATLLGIRLADVKCDLMPTGEFAIKPRQNLRGNDVFVLQPMGHTEDIDCNESLMELLNLVHSLRLAGPRRITAVVPYFAYARRDRKTKPRVPISASATAQLLTVMGVDRVVTLDLHSAQIQGFFHNVPVDNLPVNKEWEHYIRKKLCPTEGLSPEDVTIVAPDANGVERATRTADGMGAKVATILRRTIEGKTQTKTAIVGSAEGQVCVIIDDIIDSGATLVNAVDTLHEGGARAVYACVTHGLFTGNCIERIVASPLKQVAVLDTLPAVLVANERSQGKLHIVSCAPLLAECISRQHQEQPLSAVFR